MPLPLARTLHVATFTKLVGQSKVKLAGCYIIKGANLATSPVTGLTSRECYIGQSTYLGRRVKYHKGQDPTTYSFIKSLKDKGVLELFIVKSETLPDGLTKKQFITLLEQYLIIRLKPTVNKKFVATPGKMWTAETIKNIKTKLLILFIYI